MWQMESEAQDGTGSGNRYPSEHSSELLIDRLREGVRAWDASTTTRTVILPSGLIDVTVVSSRFQGLNSREREEIFWPALDSIPKPQMIHLTYCLLLSPDEAAESFSDLPRQPSAPSDSWDE